MGLGVTWYAEDAPDDWAEATASRIVEKFKYDLAYTAPELYDMRFEDLQRRFANALLEALEGRGGEVDAAG